VRQPEQLEQLATFAPRSAAGRLRTASPKSTFSIAVMFGKSA
jgi:hypothetical protein